MALSTKKPSSENIGTIDAKNCLLGQIDVEATGIVFAMAEELKATSRAGRIYLVDLWVMQIVKKLSKALGWPGADVNGWAP